MEKIFVLIKKIISTSLGIFFVGIGIALIFAETFNIDKFTVLDSTLRYLIGFVFVIYGIYRSYIGVIR
ncbi:MAG: hypothetical protein ORN85_07795 [Sediminibacterium sp.]|nr:hypothetical protein [Sediminibacterium sp.]